jgi:hypothetical protein
VTSDAQGLAQTIWTLGGRTGLGNNLVEAMAAGHAGAVSFSATAVTDGGVYLQADSGFDQTGAVGEDLAMPFGVVSTDAEGNRIGGVSVTFTVEEGDGSFAGSNTVSAVSDSKGRVFASYTLGPVEGISNNAVVVDAARRGASRSSRRRSGICTSSWTRERARCRAYGMH